MVDSEGNPDLITNYDNLDKIETILPRKHIDDKELHNEKKQTPVKVNIPKLNLETFANSNKKNKSSNKKNKQSNTKKIKGK